ncbi:hypothetical protein HDU92_004415 [Lobulomyces angularis]|nr:hypothetical protein HDU92_004415 [Lobulomyces angularis]
MEKELIKFLLNTVNDIRETLELNDVEKSHSLLKIVLEDAERHLGSCVNTGYPDSFSNTNQTRRAIPGTGECVVKNDSKLMILDKEKEKTLLANFPIELILQILPHLHRAEVFQLQLINKNFRNIIFPYCWKKITIKSVNKLLKLFSFCKNSTILKYGLITNNVKVLNIDFQTCQHQHQMDRNFIFKLIYKYFKNVTELNLTYNFEINVENITLTLAKLKSLKIFSAHTVNFFECGFIDDLRQFDSLKKGVANLQTFNFAKFNGNVPKYYELFFKLYPFSNIRRLSVPIHKDEVYDIPCYTIFKNLVELNLLLTPGWSKTIMQSILSSTVQLELLQVSEVDIMDYKALEIVSECSKSLKNLTALRFLRPKFQRTDMDTLLIEPTSKREYVEKFIFAIFEVLKNLGHNLLLFNFDAALYDIHIEDFGENLINSLVTHCENLEDFLFDTGALLSFSKENIQKLCTSLKKLKTVHLNSCAPENCEVFLQHKIELCRTTIQCETEPDTDETDEEWGDPYLMGDDYFDSEGSFFYDSDPVEFMDYEPFIF